MWSEMFDCRVSGQAAQLSAVTSEACVSGKGGRLVSRPVEVGFSLVAQQH